MKRLLILVFVMCIGAMQAQDQKEPTYEVEGDLVKATYYHSSGSIYQQGYFKDKKLTGMWTQFDTKGNKVAMGFYKEGKKVGKWFQWNKNILREITYKDSSVSDVNVWKEDVRVASNK